MHTQVSFIKTDCETSWKLSVPLCNTDLLSEKRKGEKLPKKLKNEEKY